LRRRLFGWKVLFMEVALASETGSKVV